MNAERNLLRFYRKTLDEKTEWIFKIQSTLLVVSSATFAVIVSLNNSSGDTLHNKILLSISIGVNALCILFACISVYENRVTCSDSVRIALKCIDKYLRNEIPSGQKVLFESVPRRKFFVICEKCSYITFVLYIFFLAAYAIVRNF